MKILIIEDEAVLLESISIHLQKEGHLCELAPDFPTAEDKLVMHNYDIIILDITLPGGSGLDLLTQRQSLQSRAGVLILSARNSLDDKLKGLDLGADDYLTKPFHLAELNSRINAIYRRRNLGGNSNISFNEIVITPDSRQASVKGNLLNLTRKEFDLLLYFITNKDRVLTKSAIAEHLSGDHISFADNFDFIYAHIKNLRKKIVQAGGKDYVKSVYGLGYKFMTQ